MSCNYRVAGLLVVHAHASDPLPIFGELSKSAAVPPLLKQGIMDPNVLKHYLLLHDDAAAAPHGGWARYGHAQVAGCVKQDWQRILPQKIVAYAPLPSLLPFTGCMPCQIEMAA